MITASARCAGQDGSVTTRSTGSSATRWARSGCPPTRCGGRRRSGRWRTSRSPGAAWSRPTSGRWPRSRARPPQVNADLGVLDARSGRGDRDRRRARGRRRVRRPVPDRRVPDRLGHLVQHERQRGHRHAGRPRAGPRRAPERPRQRLAVEQRRLPVVDPPGRHRRPSSHDLLPALRPPGRRAASQGGRVRRRWSRPAAPTSWTPRRSPSARSSPGTPRRCSYGIERLAVGPAPAGRAAARRHRGRHRREHPARLRRRGDRAARATTTGLPLTEARNHFEAQGARDALVEASGQLRTVAVGLYKIANDIRWMGSGPRAGLRELRLPDLQPGSSIMPGKVNPVVPEAVRQVCAQVIGNDAAVAFAGTQGDFELNVMLPVMARNLLESIRLLRRASRLLADRCVAGLEAERGGLPRRTRRARRRSSPRSTATSATTRPPRSPRRRSRASSRSGRWWSSGATSSPAS